MIRGSTYSAIMHLSVLAIILFALPSLTFIFPKWAQDDYPVRVVVMSEQTAEKLSRSPPPSSILDKRKTAKKTDREKPDLIKKPKKKSVERKEPGNGAIKSKKSKPDSATGKKKNPKPSKQALPTSPDPLKKLFGGVSIVREAAPKADTKDTVTTTRDPTTRKQKKNPVTGVTNNTSRALPTQNVRPLAKAPKPARVRQMARAPRPKAKKALSSIATGADTPARKPTLPATPLTRNEAISAVIEEMTAKIPRLKTLRTELARTKTGIKTNPALKKSISRMEKRSQEGFSHAQYSLAEMNLIGEGMPKNSQKAIKLLNSAAMNGYLPAQLTLAMLYAEGNGVKRNLAEAHTWLSVAAEQGNKAAQNALPKIEKLMTTRDIVESRKRSYQLHRVLVIIYGGDIKKASKRELSERLRIAAALGDVESVHVLLAQGADADSADIDGRTAIIEAAWRGYPGIVKSLIDNGANLSATDNTKKNALMWAAINGHAQVMSNLIAAGSPLNEQDNEGITALMRAAWNGHAEAVKILIKKKSNLYIKDKKGLTALDYAKKSGQQEVLRILRRATSPG